LHTTSICLAYADVKGTFVTGTARRGRGAQGGTTDASCSTGVPHSRLRAATGPVCSRCPVPHVVRCGRDRALRDRAHRRTMSARSSARPQPVARTAGRPFCTTMVPSIFSSSGIPKALSQHHDARVPRARLTPAASVQDLENAVACAQLAAVPPALARLYCSARAEGYLTSDCVIEASWFVTTYYRPGTPDVCATTHT
jgi:hypothetical protein